MSYAMNRAIGAYRQAAVAVPPLSAVVLLYDEVLNALILTSRHLAAREFEQAYLRTQRAVGILQGLRQNLNLETGGALAKQLLDTYTRNISAINAVCGKPDATQRLVKLSTGLLELRNAWAEMTSLSQRPLDPLLKEFETEFSLVRNA
ncbi:flagellar export chaperone FliS [Roseibium litorale]|uniref:Flagellar protein FliS n=1 Tax=Roseibium litorale TaxID=2803841 RepID=A0ABR9CKF1_9HYPH|nr:flagellar export chaperone FliS [Roseibium litorale]MBD8891321.1 flagellar protein FliS [Roseibium litorale]